IAFGEGPVWVPEGTPGGPSLVVTSVAAGALYRIPPGGGRANELAHTGGGAHGAALAADGSLLGTPNGGNDLSKMPLHLPLPPPPHPRGLPARPPRGPLPLPAHPAPAPPNPPPPRRRRHRLLPRPAAIPASARAVGAGDGLRAQR